MSNFILSFFVSLSMALNSAPVEMEYVQKINHRRSAKDFFRIEMAHWKPADKEFMQRKLKGLDEKIWPKASLKKGKMWLQFKDAEFHMEISKDHRQFIINGIPIAIPKGASAQFVFEAIEHALVRKSAFWQRLMIPEAHALAPALYAAYLAIATFAGTGYWLYSDTSTACKEVATANGQCNGKLTRAKSFLDKFTRFKAVIQLSSKARRDLAAKKMKPLHCPSDVRDAGVKYLDDSEATDTYYSDHGDFVAELKELLGELDGLNNESVLDGGAANKAANLMCGKQKAALRKCDLAIRAYLKAVCEPENASMEESDYNVTQ